MDGLTISVLNLQQSRRQIQEPLACENEGEPLIPRFTVCSGRAVVVDLHTALTDSERLWQPGTLCNISIVHCRLGYLSHLYLISGWLTYWFAKGGRVSTGVVPGGKEKENQVFPVLPGYLRSRRTSQEVHWDISGFPLVPVSMNIMSIGPLPLLILCCSLCFIAAVEDNAHTNAAFVSCVLYSTILNLHSHSE